MPSDFQTAVALVLKHEGGYEPPGTGDPGGETNFGISKRAYPNLDIKNLTRDDAIAIYQRDYWTPHMASQDDQHLANCLLDAAVNQGSGAAEHMSLGCSTLQDFQLNRLLRYTRSGKVQYYHSWFGRVLDC
jgi:lysozyme family protein